MKCIVYAVAAKQHDGSWWPWTENMARTKKQVLDEWERVRGAPFKPGRNFAIKRFYLTTTLRGGSQ